MDAKSISACPSCDYKAVNRHSYEQVRNQRPSTTVSTVYIHDQDTNEMCHCEGDEKCLKAL